MSKPSHQLPLNLSGVLPGTAIKGTHLPSRTEVGIGALMPWADKLWLVSYVADRQGSGAGSGLYFLDDDLTLTKHPASVVGTFANRMIHKESNQLFIGPHVIDIHGQVRNIPALIEKDIRLTATCRHLDDPANKVYFLGMEGEFMEVDVHTLEVTMLADLCQELEFDQPLRPHFKDAFSNHGRVVVANNSYYAEGFHEDRQNGRLAEWDGKNWTILERTQFNTVAGRYSDYLGDAIYAFGQDRASALLKLYLPATGWQTYRLPKATHTQDHAWTTEWPRLREVESERWLLDASGMFYEVPAMTYADRLWGIRPVASHLRIIGDFCSWNGLLVMAGDQTTPIGDTNAYVGQPQSNLWFGKTDDLWQWGKPQGWGGPWWDSSVTANAPSDPFLMCGFEHKVIHITADRDVTVDIQIDFRGDGKFFSHLKLAVPANSAVSHTFATGFSAHWIRLVPDADCTATAQLFYT